MPPIFRGTRFAPDPFDHLTLLVTAKPAEIDRVSLNQHHRLVSLLGCPLVLFTLENFAAGNLLVLCL